MYFTQMFFIHQYYTCAASCYSSGSLPCPSLLTTKWWRRGDLDLGSTNSSWLCHVSTTKPTSPASSSLLRFCPKLATSPRAQGKACGSSRVQPVPFQQDRIMESQNGSGWKDHRGSPGATSLLSQGHPRAHTGLQPDSSGISPARETPHPQLCQTSAALSITLLSFGVTIKGKEGSLRETWKWKEKWAIIHVM